MNKMVKGSVAGATGVVLLIGGFGTFALWSDSVGTNDGQVSAGDLDIESVGAPAWQEISGDVGPNPQPWAATDLMVPGDIVQLTQPLDVTVNGKNLKVKLSVTGITNGFSNAMSIKLDYAGKSQTFAGNGPFELSYGPADLTALTSASDALVTFIFPGTVQNQVDTNKAVDLSNVTLHLDQVRP